MALPGMRGQQVHAAGREPTDVAHVLAIALLARGHHTQGWGCCCGLRGPATFGAIGPACMFIQGGCQGFQGLAVFQAQVYFISRAPKHHREWLALFLPIFSHTQVTPHMGD